MQYMIVEIGRVTEEIDKISMDSQTPMYVDQ